MVDRIWELRHNVSAYDAGYIANHAAIAADLEAGAIVVIDDQRFRVRALPSTSRRSKLAIRR